VKFLKRFYRHSGGRRAGGRYKKLTKFYYNMQHLRRPAGSNTYCPFCKTWTKAVNDKKKKEQLATVATDTRTKKYSTIGTRPRV
jgi:hypothetical protein